jgi:hypothetical protein
MTGSDVGRSLLDGPGRRAAGAPGGDISGIRGDTKLIHIRCVVAAYIATRQ